MQLQWQQLEITFPSGVHPLVEFVQVRCPAFAIVELHSTRKTRDGQKTVNLQVSKK